MMRRERSAEHTPQKKNEHKKAFARLKGAKVSLCNLNGPISHKPIYFSDPNPHLITLTKHIEHLLGTVVCSVWWGTTVETMK